jgi:hypothetical protein
MSRMAQNALRRQLTKARAEIQHRIDVLRVPPVRGRVMDGNSSKHVIALLEEKLREIDEALSNLKTDSV